MRLCQVLLGTLPPMNEHRLPNEPAFVIEPGCRSLTVSNGACVALKADGLLTLDAVDACPARQCRTF